MNKKLICMTIFGSLFAKPLASKRFLQAPEASEALVNSVIDSLPSVSNEIPLTFWPSEEASLEMTEELVNIFENAENGEDFGEAMGEDLIQLVEAEQDFSLLDKINQLEKITVPALAVAAIAGGPEIGASVGAILALGELVNEASSALAGNSTINDALLAGTVGTIAGQALGVSAGTGLVNNLGANAIGNLVKDLLNPRSQDTNINETVNTLGELINGKEDEEVIDRIEGALGSLNNESLVSGLGDKVGDILEEAGEVAESVVGEVKEKVEDLSEKVGDVKENLGDKMKKAAGKIGKFFGKN